MKILMMGSGGVGGFFGGRLAHAGYDVAFVARGAHLAAMREHGLFIESDSAPTIHIPKVAVADNPASMGIADLIIISVKLQDTAEAIRLIKPAVGPNTAVVSLQNGVIKDDLLLAEFPAAAVMGGVAYVATHVSRPGVIHQVGTMQRIVVGEYDGTKSKRATFLVDALRAAAVNAELSTDIRADIWKKYVFLVGLSGTTTAMRSTLGPILANPQTRAFFEDVMREVVAVGRACGVNLPEGFVDDRMAFAHGLPDDMTSSMHHDLERGKPLEVNWLSGGVVQLGKKVGVPTPCNRAICDILALQAGGRE